MQAWIQQYAVRRCFLIAQAGLLVLGLLLSGCGVANSDMAASPDQDGPETAIQDHDSPADYDAGVDDAGVDDAPNEPAAEEAAADEPGQAALMIESPRVPLVSEVDIPRPGRLRTAPSKMQPMTLESPKSMASEQSHAMEAMVPEVSALESPTGSEVPETTRLPVEKAVEPAPQPFEQVTVFYATDRMALAADADTSGMQHVLLAMVISASVTLVVILLGWTGWHRRLTFAFATVGVLTTLGLAVYWGFGSSGFGMGGEGRWSLGSWSQLQQVADPGVRYGNARGTLAYGTCDVTIPATHATGEIERPSILRLEVREDAAKHVVLQATEPQPEDAFFQHLRTTVEAADRSEVFVFVHGYNVTFDGAARRTAQIAHDVGFVGAPIFFSWPSQGGLLKYTVDETNVDWAVPHLRQFLIDVTRRSGAKSVNLIAHSMGNRALTAALRELQLQLGEETALFNQVILAAPDIDAEIFRRDLAPALVQSARHVTLYASSNDQALLASKKVHGHARAGDSGEGLVVLPGIETIDVSTLDTSLLGHSYYGSSDPVLLDIGSMIREALPAAQRPFLLPRSYGGLTYWVFAKMRATATRELPQLTQ